MALRLFLEPEARDDLVDALTWYEQQRPGLGSEFLAEVARILEAVENAPERYATVRGRTRRVLVRRFPYAVYYVLDTDQIAVTAVMHGRRDPRRWQARQR